MPNQFDLLEALGAHLEGGVEEINSGYEIHQIAQQAGLVEPGQTQASSWAGDLINDGYLLFRSRYPGSPKLAPGVRWTDDHLQAHNGFRLTARGREEADRIRRRRRETITDSILAGAWSGANTAPPSGLARPVLDLQTALDQGRHAAAVSAAKDLVEAACKTVLSEERVVPEPRASLPRLFTQAKQALGINDADFGRSLAAVVVKLSELRNARGAGHGRVDADQLTAAEAQLACAAAVAVARFLLTGEHEG